MQNSVTLVNYTGGDKLHSLAAWQSTFVELNIPLPNHIPDRIDALFESVCKNKKKSPEELLKMLSDAGHHTPFEHSFLSFMVTADLASHIHFLKHRIGFSINSESARYKELTEDKIYIPEDWDDRFQERLEKHAIHCLEEYHDVIARLIEKGVSRKRAKESARYFLPYASQLNFQVSCNFRSFMHFQGLRNSEHAQVEIRNLAKEMLEQVKSIPEKPFELSLRAFGY